MTQSLESCFSVAAMSNAHTLPRLLGFFEQRALTPRSVEARLIGDVLDITIVQHGLSEAAATLIAEKMRSSVLVSHVELALTSIKDSNRC